MSIKQDGLPFMWPDNKRIANTILEQIAFELAVFLLTMKGDQDFQIKKYR